jgi:ABC-type lipoprotein release transport system permease subunit
LLTALIAAPAVAILVAAVVWRGIFGVLMLVGLVLGALIAVSLLASFVSVVYALLPAAKVPFRYNLRNLQVRWKTPLVTALAITLVTFLLTFMLAFVKGMDRLTEGSAQPGNVMVLSDGATDEAFSNLPGSFSVLSLPKDFQEMVERDGQTFWAVGEVYVIVNHDVKNPQPGGRTRRFVQMRGIDDPDMASKIHDIQLQSGRWFKRGKKEVVLGHGMAKVFGQDVGKPFLEPGEDITIGPVTWRVVGVMSPASSAFGSEVWAGDTHIKENFGRPNSYSSYVARVKDPKLARAAADLVKKERGQQAFQAMPETEYYEKMSQTNQQFLVAIIFVAIVMAVGGVLGVMNTMFAAISQRTKDIGMLRLLGFTRWQILMSFLLESLVIAFIGGVLGCGLGSLTDGWTANSIVSSGAGGGGKFVVLKLTVDGATLAVGFFFTLVMGSVGGLVPSLSAMRLKPLESLR